MRASSSAGKCRAVPIGEAAPEQVVPIGLAEQEGVGGNEEDRRQAVPAQDRQDHVVIVGIAVVEGEHQGITPQAQVSREIGRNRFRRQHVEAVREPGGLPGESGRRRGNRRQGEIRGDPVVAEDDQAGAAQRAPDPARQADGAGAEKQAGRPSLDAAARDTGGFRPDL